MALVVGDVVDQCVHAADGLLQIGHRGLQRGHVGHVTGTEDHAWQAGCQGLARDRVAVQKADLAALVGECTHHVRTDAAGATGDEHTTALEAVETRAGELHWRHAGRIHVGIILV